MYAVGKPGELSPFFYLHFPTPRRLDVVGFMLLAYDEGRYRGLADGDGWSIYSLGDALIFRRFLTE